MPGGLATREAMSHERMVPAEEGLEEEVLRILARLDEVNESEDAEHGDTQPSTRRSGRWLERREPRASAVLGRVVPMGEALVRDGHIEELAERLPAVAGLVDEQA
jgi:hypothetical protein